jgi:hypothetical protein
MLAPPICRGICHANFEAERRLGEMMAEMPKPKAQENLEPTEV